MDNPNIPRGYQDAEQLRRRLLACRFKEAEFPPVRKRHGKNRLAMLLRKLVLGFA